MPACQEFFLSVLALDQLNFDPAAKALVAVRFCRKIFQIEG